MQYHQHDTATRHWLTWPIERLRTLSTNIDLVGHVPNLRRVGPGLGVALGLNVEDMLTRSGRGIGVAAREGQQAVRHATEGEPTSG